MTQPRNPILERLLYEPPKPEPIRYAIYTRQSVETLTDFSSCDAQFQTCQDFARALAEPGTEWCGQRFDDQGYSGATLERPGMRKLRKVVDLGGVSLVYAVAVDRLTRNMRDAVVLIDEFEKAGVEVRFVHQPGLTFSAQGRFIRHVLVAFAEFERDMIATRFAETRTYLKRNGRRLAGKVPYGYDTDPRTKQLMPNPVEAPRIAEIFRRAAEGELPRQIAIAINDLGWPTKIYHSQRSGKTTGGGQWTARQIIDTLRNPVHIGRFNDGDDSRDGSHEAIVDQATFDVVQKQLDSRRTTDRKKRTQHDNLAFRQKIVCPQCGRFLTAYQSASKVTKNSSVRRHYYACRSTAGGKPRCKGISYPAWDFEHTVSDLFKHPDIWRNLMGEDTPEDMIEKIVKTWDVLIWPWQQIWLKAVITKIELDPDDGSASMAFDMVKIRSLCDQIRLSVNRPVPE